ncbi:hypothetical protein R4P64_30075 [Rhodococcus sp. IEGM 1366]|uniref:hypothetical protein n=1 Tax=Rhodococcus sp. IEGM 1366 TaxID=3082223 RepID=UPI002952F672|nr:hypothetical protein [Rhodococcus sp. IEGM 1366]MDV8070778.1 hypothetical protein [Rhodococcus sp. IEGM 1366]
MDVFVPWGLDRFADSDVPVPMVDIDPETGKMPPLNLSTAVSRAYVSGVLITKGKPGDPGPGIASIDPDGTVHLTDGLTVSWELPPAIADDAAVAELVTSETETAAVVAPRIREVGDGTYAPIGSAGAKTDDAASDAVNSWHTNPRSLYSALRDRAYQGVVSENGTIGISVHDRRRGTASKVNLGKYGVDDHNCPAFLFEDDKVPVAAIVQHAVEPFVRLRLGAAPP